MVWISSAKNNRNRINNNNHKKQNTRTETQSNESFKLSRANRNRKAKAIKLSGCVLCKTISISAVIRGCRVLIWIVQINQVKKKKKKPHNKNSILSHSNLVWVVYCIVRQSLKHKRNRFHQIILTHSKVDCCIAFCSDLSSTSTILTRHKN